MVLVDTSVWIRFLRDDEPFASGLDALLAHGHVVAHELVHGELLMGDVGGARAPLLDDYVLMEQAAPIPHDDVVDFVRARELHGRGAGWIDVHLLASALTAGALLWTADARCDALARELGIGYEPRSRRPANPSWRACITASIERESATPAQPRRIMRCATAGMCWPTKAPVLLAEEHVLLRTMLHAPLLDPPLEGAELARLVAPGVPLLQRIEQRHRSELGGALKLLLDPRPVLLERVLARPPRSRLLQLAR